MLEFDLDKGRKTVQVTIGGEPYEARLGNLTFALDAKLLGEKMRAISEDGLSAEEVVARAEDFAGLARSMAAAMFGEEGAERLLGGTHRLDIPRIAEVIGIMADITDSDESMAAAREAVVGLS